MLEQKKKCPKCGTEMDRQHGDYAIPQYIDHDKRGPDKAEVSVKSALPASVHFCPNCRFVELWAD